MPIGSKKGNIGFEGAGCGFEGVGVELEGAGVVELRELVGPEKSEHDY